MLKVLYLPLGDQPGMVDAFKAIGAELEVFDFYQIWEYTKNKNTVAKRFLDKVRDMKPHLIHMQLQFTGLMDGKTLDEARKICPNVVITNWSGDVRAGAITSFVDVAHHIDHALISSTGQLELYKKAGCNNIKYWQIGYNPKINFPLNKTEFKYDVSFLGNHYGNMFPDGNLRNSVAVALRKEFGTRFGLFGNGYKPNAPSIEPIKSNEAYNQSICTLSISNFNSISHYFSDRLLSCLASGRPTISWYFPGYESYFVDGKEIFIVRSAKEIIDKVNYCKKNPDIATEIGKNGQQRVLKEHTFTSRVVELIHMTNLTHLL